MGKTKFGLFFYNTENIGDEVQSIAAKRFLPRVDYYFDRDNIDGTDTGDDEVKIIMNGWFTHKPENWPPKNKNINPLLIAMHVEQDALNGRVAKAFVTDESKRFLNEHGPVGARNYPTLELLNKNGVEAYFSGCVTLTLKPDPRIKRQDYVLAVDVSDKVFDNIKSRTKRRVIRLDTYRSPDMTREEKFALAYYWLYLYQSAHAVVTTRLHTMLPCLAFQTPVFAIAGRDPKRYSGLIDLVRHASENEFIKNEKLFDLDKPDNNPEDYLALRKNLEQTCRKFTGFDSERSFLGDYDLTSLLLSPDFAQVVCDSVYSTLKRDLLIGDVAYLKELTVACEERIASLQSENQALKDRICVLENPTVKDAARRLVNSTRKSVAKRIARD